MYKIRERKRKLRVNNPAAFGILCAMLVVIGIGAVYGLAAGVVAPGVRAIQAANATPSPIPEITEAPAIITSAPVLTPQIDASPDVSPEPEETPVPAGSGKLAGKVIGLDPARGYDSKYKGVSTGIYANRLNMAVALAVKTALEAEGAKVVMTYTDIQGKPTADERALALNNGGVDVALCIECNHLSNAETRGTQVWTPVSHSQQAACEKLARAVLEGYVASTGLPTRAYNGSTLRKVDDKDVFNKTKAPICMLITGHISNATEDKLINDEAFQEKMANGVVQGLIKYFG